MALSKKDLEAITIQNYMDALNKHDLLGRGRAQAQYASQASQVDMSALDSELIPTEYEAQKAYYKNRKRAAQYRDGGVCPPPILHDQFKAVLEGKFLDENAEPIQSLTKTYIKMMENEGSDGDNWDRALQILYPEKEDK